MAIKDALLQEFDQEMANTRKTIERIPDDKLAWKPHQKSMTMGRLAEHLSELPGWAAETMNKTSIDISQPFERKIATSIRATLEGFDRNVANARTAIGSADDAAFMQPWSLMAGDKAIFTMPKMAVMRSFVMNHIIHHRAQLGVYLRLNDIAVPSIYGPSADEQTMGAGG
jgi:uncharacterized damage-inducible protein DinB